MMFSGGGSSGSSRGDNDSLGGHLTRMNVLLPMSFQLETPAIASPAGDKFEVEFPRRDERVPQWGNRETRDFIAIRAELERDFTISKRNKTLWEVVAAKMKERGYRRTPDQCKCKWKNLVNRYKGKETSDPDAGRQCPFFDELQAVFIERENNMQRLLLESETSSLKEKKRVKRITGDSSEEFSEGENDDEERSDEERSAKPGNFRKGKPEREKRSRTSLLEKPQRQSNVGNTSSEGASVQDLLRDFLQQQQRIEIQWRESVEKRAQERQKFELEWRETMEKLERERLMIEQAWREREEQRRIREESRAERRDALLETLLNKLIQENQL